MAEAIVVDLAAGLVRKLVSLATNEVIQVWKLHEDLETLRERFELMGALLHDAHTKNLIMSTARIWFNKLEEVAHVADAFMDELEYEVTRRLVENRHKVRDFFTPKNTLIYRTKVAHKIKNINASFDKICKWATDIGLKPVEHLRSIVQHREMRATPPFEDESLIVGRDNDMSVLISMLSDKSDEVLPVNAILGMGGQGKTTLARMVYNKDVVINMFPKRMWVTVSDDFDFMKILNQMVVSLTSRPSVLENVEGLIRDLQEKLQGTKFLLVLDDVWNEKPQEWERLRNSLLGVGGARGSNILVTTRSQKVVDTMRCSDPYQVKKLSEEDSWKLFKQRAFANGGVSESGAFVNMGRTMVNRCGGLPLAIKALGGLLYPIKTEQEWLRIQNSEIWKSEGVLSSLRLSYDNLPHSAVKRCFAYCSILPKDSDIYKDRLVQIWMSLGFLSGDGKTLMEDVGNEYFDILLWNSLLQDAEKDEYGNINRCKMHDLVHDLAIDVSSNYSATVKISHDFNKVSKALHVRLEGFEDLKQNIVKAQFDTVQALYADANLYNVLPKLMQLRVLVLHSPCTKLPSSIGNLKYLKHLDIDFSVYQSPTYKLPNYITRLYNLQTLRISDRHELPDKVCNLINLRHLVTGGRETHFKLPGIDRLTCLQTLPCFLVSRDRNVLVGQLGALKNLRGELRLHALKEVESFEEASEAKLHEKSNIQCLCLRWGNTDYGSKDSEDRKYDNEEVMKGLEPHPNLKGLTIVDFMGKKLASWITMMSNLVNITLRNCNRCEILPPLGHLPKLRKIEINWMENVKSIGYDSCGAPKAVTTTLYPTLTELSLIQMPKLEEWEEAVISTGVNGRSVFPKLESLSIWGCPRLRKIPNSCFPSLKMVTVNDLESSMMLKTMSRNVSLTSLELTHISDRGGRGDSSSSSCRSIIDMLIEHNSVSLTSLCLAWCKSLKHLTLGVSLDRLEVYNCRHLISINVVQAPGCLKSLKIGGLPYSVLDGALSQIQSSTLVELRLGPFLDEPDDFPWPFSSSSSSSVSLPNLISLKLYGWKNLKTIPIFEQLQFSTFPALTELFIICFDGVRDLLHSSAKLPPLKDLLISKCKNLESLPMLDETHCLQSLKIYECPILRERYNKESGQEWFKIQHIPYTSIH